MRRFILLSLFIAITASPIAAQATGSVMGGLVSANLAESNGSQTVSFSSRLGVAAGLELALPMGRAHDWDLVPQFLYVQKGAVDNETDGSAKIRISYLEIPLLARIMVGNGATRPFVFAGPHIAFKVACSFAVELTSGNTGSADCNNSDDFNVASTDIGATVGIGVQFARMALSARYDIGFSNVAPNSDPGTTVKNRAFLFMGSIVVK